VAKGMGNGFPVGGVMIRPDIKGKHGMLGTTFGGNYLACVASLAVLEVIEEEHLMKNAAELGDYWMGVLRNFPNVLAVRGRGLMIGFDLPAQLSNLRKDLLFKHHIFTGEAKPNTIRLLPSLALKKEEAETLVRVLDTELKQAVVS
jgi:acetylornithine/N-succinyldiaminopimelate aminotransferase